MGNLAKTSYGNTSNRAAQTLCRLDCSLIFHMPPFININQPENRSKHK